MGRRQVTLCVTREAMRILLLVAFVCLAFVFVSNVNGERRKAQLQYGATKQGRSLGNQGKHKLVPEKSGRSSSKLKVGNTDALKQEQSITKNARKQGESIEEGAINQGKSKKEGAIKQGKSKKEGTRKQGGSKKAGARTQVKNKKEGARKQGKSKKEGARKQGGSKKEGARTQVKNKKEPASEENQRSGIVPQARACDATCIDNAVKYMKMQRGKVATLKKQMSLITRHTSTAEKKSSKNSVFETVVARLIDNSGGDVDNPECGAQTTGSGVDQIKNLTNILMNCSVAVEAACADVPSVDVSTCNSSLVTFEALVTNCFGKDDGELCDCWTADDISSAYTELKDLNCDFKTEAD